MQSAPFAEYMEHIGWQTKVITKKGQKTFVYLKKLPLLGYVAKSPKILFPFPLKEMETLVANRPKLLLRLEPNMFLPENKRDQDSYKSLLIQHGYGNTWLGCELQTIRVNLTKTPQKILESIPRENTRRNIRIAQKRFLIAEESDDLDLFYALHQQTAKRQHFYCPPKHEIEALWHAFLPSKSAKLLLVKTKQGDPLVAIFLLLHQSVAYYRYVGSSDIASELRAPSLAVWESFLLAKKYKCKWFDFYGINDERSPTRSWRGFTHFKEGFSENKLRFVLPAAKYYPPAGPLVHLFDRVV